MKTATGKVPLPRIFVWLLAMISIGIGFGCRSAHSVVMVKAGDNGKSATIAPGDTLLITLSTTPGTGYGWRVTGISCVAQTADPQIEAAPSSLVGAPQNETFVFDAISTPCIGMVELDYVRPWERDRPPAKTFRLKIEVR